MHEGRLLPQKRTTGLRTCNLQAAPSSWPGACYRGIPRMPTATRSSSQPARLVLLASAWSAYGSNGVHTAGLMHQVHLGRGNHLEIVGM